MASDFPVTTATELDAGAELDVLAGVLFAVLVVTEDTAVDEPVLMLVAVLDATDTLVDVAVVIVADVLARAVLDTLVSPCTEPVPEASWYGDGKHYIRQRERKIKREYKKSLPVRLVGQPLRRWHCQCNIRPVGRLGLVDSRSIRPHR